jgi:hypothetical protein
VFRVAIKRESVVDAYIVVVDEVNRVRIKVADVHMETVKQTLLLEVFPVFLPIV